MRGWFVVVVVAAALATPASAGNFAQAYAKSGEASFAAGRWGEAMAAFDAAHNEAPSDAAITARRRDAAAKWVEVTARELANATPTERALALLSALADEGNKRGADAAVKQHVAPALDAAVQKAWNGDERSDDPKLLWQAVSRGEQLTQALPEGAAARAKLDALRQHAAALYDKRAAEAKAPGSAYLWESMAARMKGRKPDAARRQAWRNVTEFDFKLTVGKPNACPALEPAFAEKLRQMGNSFSSIGYGLPVEVDVRFDCVPLARPKQRQESRTWVDRHLEFNSTKSCSPQTVLVSAQSHTETTVWRGSNYKTVRTVDVPAQYKTVENCSTSYSSRQVSETKTDLLTITTEEQGFDARGRGGILVEGKAYVMPLGARVVTERVTTEGRIFGSKEGFSWFEPKLFASLTAHALWLEMVYLSEQAHDGYAAELVQRAAAGDADASLADKTNAVGVARRVTTSYARWFAERLGLSEQELNELLLDAPRVRPPLRIAGGYKLDVPKADPNLVKAVEKKKKDSGAEDFR